MPFGIAKPRSSSSAVIARSPGALDQERADRASTAGDGQAVVQHLARRAVESATSASEQLDPLAIGLEPGAGEGGEGADLALDLLAACVQSIRASALSILGA